MTQRVLTVGTRGSALALAQSGAVATILAETAGAVSDLVRIKTEGDVNAGPLASIGGTGIFVTALRSALLEGRVDVIVHSYKDLPTAPADGLTIGAVPAREDPADALCARDGLTLDQLPPGARVGTGSPRRAAQLLRRRPDLLVEPIRGNVDTRLRMVGDGRVDAVVLAVSGLARLGRTVAITQRLGPDIMLPAAAQGALAVECRSADRDTAWYAGSLSALDSAPTRAAVTAERSLLAALEAGCIAPVGAQALVRDGALILDAVVLAVDGSDEIRARTTGPVARADELGRELARGMLSSGAASLLGAVR
ncbi:MAG TPA: hydroxymethylbilane synthase [Nakamurella sp.]|nr:hydroxymethylbilane synthase [Nakamurella sp.]